MNQDAARSAFLLRIHPAAALGVGAFCLAQPLLLGRVGSVATLVISAGLAADARGLGRWTADLIRFGAPAAGFLWLLQISLSRGASGMAGVGAADLAPAMQTVVTALRVLALVGTALAFGSEELLHHLALWLAGTRLPATLTLVIVATIQLVPFMRTRVRRVVEAQQARGVEVGPSLVKRVRALPLLFTPVVLDALVEASDRAIALEMRGISARATRVEWLDSLSAPSNTAWLSWVIPFVLVVEIVTVSVGW